MEGVSEKGYKRLPGTPSLSTRNKQTDHLLMKPIHYLSIALAALLVSGCTQKQDTPATVDNALQHEYASIVTVRLTVGESKRLIAKGIAANPEIRERMKEGIVIITLGTTNTYIAEELAGLQAPRGSFVTGRIFPTTKEDFAKEMERHNEIVLVNGKISDLSYAEALARLTEKDIVLKGANLLNYAKRQAAVCVGAPDGGTVAKLRRYTDQGKGRWIVPIGLEKETTQDLMELQRLVNGSQHREPGTVRLNATQGNVYTEIEAIREFADVDVFVTAKGGVDGAEGGVSLLLCGEKAEVKKAEAAVRQVAGEPPFVQ